MILALKTADQTTHISLHQPDSPAASLAHPTPVASVEWQSGRELSAQLLGRMSGFLEQNNLTFTDLTGIIIFSGPGSFTSLRIGHTVANALADSLAIPVAGGQGHDWLAHAIEALKSAKPGHPALPHYGAEAHITRPKA